MDGYWLCTTITIHLFSTYSWHRKQSFTFPFHHFYVYLPPIYASFGFGWFCIHQDIKRGKRVADHIDTGMVFINHPTWTQANLPFGGTKNSGYGSELSELGIDEFVNKKLIYVSGLSDPF